MICPEPVLQYYDELFDNAKFTEAGPNLVHGFEQYLEPGLKNYVTDLIGKHELSVGMLLHSLKPFKPHVDHDKVNNRLPPFLAVLIPLETKDTYTIVFNETARNRDEFLSLPPIDPMPNQEIWQKYLTNCDQKNYPGLSVQSIHKWNRGEPILWHRLQAHTSDNYTKKHSDKKAIVLFTEK